MSTAVDPVQCVYNIHAYITVVVQRRSVCRIRTSGINKLEVSHNNSYHYHYPAFDSLALIKINQWVVFDLDPPGWNSAYCSPSRLRMKYNGMSSVFTQL